MSRRRSSLFTTLAAAALVLFLAPVAMAADDDGDGLSDAYEQAIGTTWQNDPYTTLDTDTDQDGWDDYDEVFVYGTSPLMADTDGDGTDDPYDSSPLLWPTGDQDGNGSPTHTGAPTSPTSAASGESATDGVGVYVHSGALNYQAEAGGAQGVMLPFGFSLSYYSKMNFDGFVGMNWISWLDFQTARSGNDVRVLTEQGYWETWVWTGTAWTEPRPNAGTLTEPTTDEFKRELPNGYELYYANDRLYSVTDPYGNAITLTWSGGQATKFTDSRGEDHTLAYYTGTGRLKSITMADARAWEFFYTETNQLARIEGPATTTFGAGITWEFRYTNGSSTTSLNHNMIAAIDGKGQSWLQMTYDSSDRVLTQSIGGDELSFDYSSIGSNKTTVTDRAGNDRVWEWDASLLTRKKLEQKSNRNVRTSDPTSWDTSWTHDADGYLATVTYPAGNGIKYTRNSVKLVTERRHKASMSAADSASNDLIHTWTYDASKNYGALTYVDPEGHETDYTLNAAGQTTQIDYPDSTHVSPTQSVTESYTYNSNGTVATFTDGEGSVTSYSYYSTPNAKKGRVETVTRDSGTGKLNLVTDFDYTDWGQVKEVTDPEGNVTTHTIEAYGNVTQTDSPSALGYITKFTQDANLNVTQKLVKNIDENGTAQTSPVAWWKTTYTYTIMDKLEDEKAWLDASNYRRTFVQYDANENVSEWTRGDLVVQMTYDERDLLAERVKDPGASPALAITEAFDYDLNGNLDEYTDPRGKVTTHLYDDYDRRIKTTNPLGDYQVVVYDKHGSMTERKFYEDATPDVLMSHQKFTYDEMNRMWKDEAALISGTTTWLTRTMALDKRSNPVTLTDRRGNDTTIAYDGAGRRSTVTDELGNVATLTYDDNGNVVTVAQTETIPGSGSTETYETDYEFDAINRMKKQTVIDRTSGTNTKVTQWKRNSRNVVAQLIDPLGWTTTNTHDALGRRTQESRQLDGSGGAAVTQWTFNDNDLVTQLSDDNGNTTDYAYDAVLRLTTKTYDDATTWSAGYDAAGNLTDLEDRAGNVIDLAYDDLNRLTDRDVYSLATGFGGDTAEDFAYDALSRLTQAKDDDSIVEFTYDSLGRVLTEKQGANPFGSTAKTVTYTYDAESNATVLEYDSGFEAHRTFDAINRMTAVDDASSVSIAEFAMYGAGSRMKTVTFGNSTKAGWTYDGFRRPTAISHVDSYPTQFAGFEYAWDKNDNPLYEERSHQSGKGDVYTYDRANRLIQVLQGVDDPAAEVASPGTETYVDKVAYNMDDVLNFTSLVTTPYGGSASTVSYTTNGMNEYTAVGGTTHVYDDNGNLTDDGVNDYVYDWKNHLIEVIDQSSSTTVAEYAYDCFGLGRRFEKVVGSDTTRFVYADQQCLEEYDGSGSLLRLFAFGAGIDEIVMMEAPDVADVDSDTNTSELKRFYYHRQLIGSVTHITDPDENVVESYDYGPYGEIEIFDIGSSSISASAIGNPFTYTSRRLDEETGLYYYRARHYSAELKRFIQRDPLEYVDGPNASAYVQGEAVRGTDPKGLEQPPEVHDFRQAEVKPERDIEVERTPEGNWVIAIRYEYDPLDWAGSARRGQDALRRYNALVLSWMATRLGLGFSMSGPPGTGGGPSSPGGGGAGTGPTTPGGGAAGGPGSVPNPDIDGWASDLAQFGLEVGQTFPQSRWGLKRGPDGGTYWAGGGLPVCIFPRYDHDVRLHELGHADIELAVVQLLCGWSAPNDGAFDRFVNDASKLAGSHDSRTPDGSPSAYHVASGHTGHPAPGDPQRHAEDGVRRAGAINPDVSKE